MRAMVKLSKKLVIIQMEPVMKNSIFLTVDFQLFSTYNFLLLTRNANAVETGVEKKHLKFAQSTSSESDARIFKLEQYIVNTDSRSRRQRILYY